MNLSKKIVFFDIDGTLLDHDKKIPVSTKEAIAKLKENGIIVAIATGRAPFMFREILEELDIQSFVSLNGQYAVYNDEVIHEQPYSEQQMCELVTFSKDHNHPLVFQSSDEMSSTVLDHPHILEGMSSLKREQPNVDEEFYKKKPVYQVLLFNQNHEQKKYEEAFDYLRFVRWHEFSCDVLPQNGSKAHGIEQFIQHLNINWEDTYAFGDGLNDIEMIEKVNYGVVMGNGEDVVKEKAYYVTSDVAEDGIKKGLEKLNLI